MQLEATSRQIGDHDSELHQWVLEGADYDSAYAPALASVPDGHQLLYVRSL